MTETRFDRDRLAVDCHGIAGSYPVAVDYDYEHRCAEHEHEGEA